MSTRAAENILAEIKARQRDLCVSDKELDRVVGWSERTRQRRFNDPDKITMGEYALITNYLNMRRRNQK